MSLSIAAEYNEKPLDWVNKDLAKDAPITLTAIEKTTINVNYLTLILSGSLQSPSKCAGLDPNKISSPVLRSLDINFTSAYRDYKELFRQAQGKDYTTATNLKLLNPNLWRRIISFFTFKSTKEKRLHEVSIHRRQWMVIVDDREKTRLKNMKTKIEEAIKPILEDLQVLSIENQASKERLAQLKELVCVYKVFYPEDYNTKYSNQVIQHIQGG